jgi:serine/threonine protein kinase
VAQKEQLLNDRYLLNRQLSTGGMGIVYEGFDTLLRTPVAIKQCLFEEEILRRAFEREAQLLANLSHRSLPQCIDFFTSGKHQYLVMRLIEGRTGEELLSDYPRGLPMEIVKDLARQMLDVIEYLHSELVLHRDIKTSNIKIKDGQLYLLDLGVAYGQTGEMNTVASGDLSFPCHSLHYSPPEQLENEPPSPAGDLYSLAATLYKLITGKAPEDSRSRLKHGEELTQPLTDSDNQVFVSAIMRALSLDRKLRPQNASEMRRMMFPDKPTPLIVNIPQQAPRSKRSPFIIAVCAVCLMFLLAALLWKGRSPNLPPVAAPNKQEVADPNGVHSRIREGARLAEESEDWLEKGKDSAAEKKASEAIDADPENTKARRVLGEVAKNAQRDTGDFESPSSDAQTQAKTIQQLLSKRNETNGLTSSERIDLAWAEFQLAEHSDDVALLEKAIAGATDVLSIEPNSVAALMILLEASYEKHLWNKNPAGLKSFIAKINQVLSARPRYAYAYVVRGNIRAALHEYERARDSYTTAAKLMPRASTYYLVAVATLQITKRREANLESACKYLTQTLEKNPKFRNAMIHLADVYDEMGDTDTANTYRTRAKAEE